MFRKVLADEGVLDEAAADALEAEVKAEVDEGVRFANDSPFPEPYEAYEDLYVNPIPLRK